MKEIFIAWLSVLAFANLVGCGDDSSGVKLQYMAEAIESTPQVTTSSVFTKGANLASNQYLANFFKLECHMHDTNPVAAYPTLSDKGNFPDRIE